MTDLERYYEAKEAYYNGEKPLSKWTKADIIEAIENAIREEELTLNCSAEKLKKTPVKLRMSLAGVFFCKTIVQAVERFVPVGFLNYNCGIKLGISCSLNRLILCRWSMRSLVAWFSMMPVRIYLSSSA